MIRTSGMIGGHYLARFSEQISNPLAGRSLMHLFTFRVLVSRLRSAFQQHLYDAGLLLARLRRTTSSSPGGLNGKVQRR